MIILLPSLLSPFSSSPSSPPPFQVVLVLWEQSYDESHYTYHIHESHPGWLLVLLRVGLAVLIAHNLHQTSSGERSVLKRDFYQSFAIVSVYSHPLCVS